MAVSPGLTAQQRHHLEEIWTREEAAFQLRIPRSLALGSTARHYMPNGVPMAWMAGYYRTPPLWVTHGSGAAFTDVDGHSYVDFNVGDMSTILGYAHPRLTQVIADQAARSVAMFLPIESAIVLCEQLRLRFGLPMWQFTTSASAANLEALRIARLATGRQGVLLFSGKYHGMLDETLWSDEDGVLAPEALGVAATPPPDLSVVDFNDLDAVDSVLRRERTSAVLTEGVLTNAGTVLPDPGFLAGVRELCSRHGTLLILDETHTLCDLYGGAVAHYGISPDIVTGGKGIAGGIPMGAYGMTAGLGALVAQNLSDEAGNTHGVALGGTLFANALSLACAAVVLADLMTPAEHDRIAGLGQLLADGIEAATRDHGLDWRAHRFGARTGYCLQPELPRNANEAHASLDPLFSDTRRVYFANRGLWDAIGTSGPHPGFAHQPADIDLYLGCLDEFLTEMCRGRP
ncbi:MAG TPA: aminotransferase class III-fold pyridoxal phosphate-dependent enzyme [Streptosporangiaceae bacterium]|nr:aminotransferase class III-fold pyridoxal phosphate-dependent enzyme [Streptosporangiaceae bacterium]